jgi:hypothetical protein
MVVVAVPLVQVTNVPTEEQTLCAWTGADSAINELAAAKAETDKRFR